MSVLKAITARSPCRKIPKESISAPFSQPRVSVPGVGLEDIDVFVMGTAGCPAPTGRVIATSLSWDCMSTTVTENRGAGRGE